MIDNSMKRISGNFALNLTYNFEIFQIFFQSHYLFYTDILFILFNVRKINNKGSNVWSKTAYE